MNKLYIIAGTYRQAQQWAAGRPFTFVHHATVLLGLDAGTPIYRLGTWHTRQDLRELASLCSARDLPITDVR